MEVPQLQYGARVPDISVPQIVEEQTVEVVKVFPQEQISVRTVGHIADVPVILRKRRHVPVGIPQEWVPQRAVQLQHPSQLTSVFTEKERFGVRDR